MKFPGMNFDEVIDIVQVTKLSSPVNLFFWYFSCDLIILFFFLTFFFLLYHATYELPGDSPETFFFFF